MKITIITTTFNSSRFVKDCLESVKSQNYKNIEHIIIDGGSTDETLSILNSKKTQLSKIISEPDQGTYDAMNKGINYAQGDIIGFLNSDDIYFNNEVLFKVVNIFKKNSNLDACYSDLVYTKPDQTNKFIRYWKSSKFKPGMFSKGWCPPHPTFFVRSSVYKRYGKFNIKYKISSDVELMMRFFEIHKINFQYVPEIWVKMRMGGISNKNLKNIFKQNIEVLNALYSNNLTKNILLFFICKFISRLKQFFRRP